MSTTLELKTIASAVILLKMMTGWKTFNKSKESILYNMEA
jgi:hypothetical protein